MIIIVVSSFKHILNSCLSQTDWRTKSAFFFLNRTINRLQLFFVLELERYFKNKMHKIIE